MPLDIAAPEPVDNMEEPPTDFLVVNDSLLVTEFRGVIHVVDIAASNHREILLPCEMAAAFMDIYDNDKILVAHRGALAVVGLNGDVFYEFCDADCFIYDVAVDRNNYCYFDAHQKVDNRGDSHDWVDNIGTLRLDSNYLGVPDCDGFRRNYSVNSQPLFVDDKHLFYLNLGVLTALSTSVAEDVVYDFNKLMPPDREAARLLGSHDGYYLILLSRRGSQQDAVLTFNGTFNRVGLFNISFGGRPALRRDISNFAYMDFWSGGVMYYLDTTINKLYALGFSTEGECVLYSCRLPDFRDDSGAQLKGATH